MTLMVTLKALLNILLYPVINSNRQLFCPRSPLRLVGHTIRCPSACGGHKCKMYHLELASLICTKSIIIVKTYTKCHLHGLLCPLL